MRADYLFHLDLGVHCPETLYQAALRQAVDVDGLDEADAKAALCPDGVLDIHACLIELLDPGSLPGCSIYSSSVEVLP